MTDEELIRSRYPGFYVHYEPPVFQNPTAAPIRDEYYAVYPAHELGHVPIAEGPNRLAAIRAAARIVEKEARTARSEAWIAYLLKQGFRRSEEDSSMIVDPEDPTLFAGIDPNSGLLVIATGLQDRVNAVMGDDRMPPKE